MTGRFIREIGKGSTGIVYEIQKEGMGTEV